MPIYKVYVSTENTYQMIIEADDNSSAVQIGERLVECNSILPDSHEVHGSSAHEIDRKMSTILKLWSKDDVELE